MIHGLVSWGGVTLEPNSGWWQPGGGEWTTAGTGIRLHSQFTPDYILPYPYPLEMLPSVMPSRLVFTTDGRHLVAVFFGDEKGKNQVVAERMRIVTWDLSTRQVVADVDRDEAYLDGGILWLSQSLSPDGQVIANVVKSEQGGTYVRGIDTATGREVGRAPLDRLDEDFVIESLAFAPDGHSIYCAYGNRLFAADSHTWQVRATTVLPGRVSEEAVGPSHIVVSTIPLSQGRFGTFPDRAIVLSAQTLQQVHVLSWLPKRFSFAPGDSGLLAYSVGPRYGGSGSPPEGEYLLDPITGSGRRSWTGFSGSYLVCNRPVFSPDRQWSANLDSPSSDACSYLWSYPGLDQVWRLGAPTSRHLATPAFSPESRLLATVTDKGIAIWSLPTAAAANPLPPALPTPAGGRERWRP